MEEMRDVEASTLQCTLQVAATVLRSHFEDSEEGRLRAALVQLYNGPEDSLGGEEVSPELPARVTAMRVLSAAHYFAQLRSHMEAVPGRGSTLIDTRAGMIEEEASIITKPAAQMDILLPDAPQAHSPPRELSELIQWILATQLLGSASERVSEHLRLCCGPRLTTDDLQLAFYSLYESELAANQEALLMAMGLHSAHSKSISKVREKMAYILYYPLHM
jgi:hypothetical protein